MSYVVSPFDHHALRNCAENNCRIKIMSAHIRQSSLSL